MWKIFLATAVALFAYSPATAEAATARTVSVLGTAEISVTDPPSTFDFRIHARGDGRSGDGVIWMSHHNDTQIGWAVARVDCVRHDGRHVVVSGVVGDAQDYAAAGPGDRVSVSVRDGDPDLIGFGSREQVTRCRGPRPDFAITGGDLRITVE